MINSNKIKKILKFEFKKSVLDAIEDLCTAFDKNLIVDSFSDQWSNIKVLTNLEKNRDLNKYNE